MKFVLYLVSIILGALGIWFFNSFDLTHLSFLNSFIGSLLFLIGWEVCKKTFD